MALGKETRKSDGGWFPSIIGPNEKSARHIAGDVLVEPTPSYDATSMPLFRKNPAPSADEE